MTRGDVVLTYRIAYVTAEKDVTHVSIASREDDPRGQVTGCGRTVRVQGDFLPARIEAWRSDSKSPLCLTCVAASARAILTSTSGSWTSRPQSYG